MMVVGVLALISASLIVVIDAGVVANPSELVSRDDSSYDKDGKCKYKICFS